MGASRYFVSFCCLGMALVQLQGCRYLAGTHRTLSRSESKQYFYRHQSDFQKLVEEWTANHKNDVLVYRPWDRGEIRWNGTSIYQNGSNYVVQKASHEEIRSASFSSAAQLAGADPADLASWLSSLKRLNVGVINVIGTEGPISKQFVQIGLQEAGADYGYLYVPTGHDVAQTLVVAASQKQPNLIGMVRVEPLAPQWFYFEGKGAL